MTRHLAAGLIGAMLLSAPMTAMAAQPGVAQIARCMAFFAVSEGMDGEKQVDPAIAQVVRELGQGLYEAADREKISEADLHQGVVNELVGMNTRVREEGGLAALRREYRISCENVVDNLRGLP